MDKKLLYILTVLIVLSLLFVSRADAQNADLSIKLESESDTLYFGQEGRLKVTFYKESWFPIRIKIHRQIRYAKASDVGQIYLEVSKNGMVYQSLGDPFVKYSKEFFLISKWHPIVANGTIDIGETFSEVQRRKIQNQQDGYHWNSKNKDIGTYRLRAFYYTESGDSVYSNPVTIHYLEK